MHLPLAVSDVLLRTTARVHQMIMQQWHAATTTRHSYTHTHTSVPYWCPDIWLGLELLRDLQFGLSPNWISRSNSNHKCIHVTRIGAWQPKNFSCASRTSGWTPLTKFLNPPLVPALLSMARRNSGRRNSSKQTRSPVYDWMAGMIVNVCVHSVSTKCTVLPWTIISVAAFVHFFV